MLFSNLGEVSVRLLKQLQRKFKIQQRNLNPVKTNPQEKKPGQSRNDLEDDTGTFLGCWLCRGFLDHGGYMDVLTVKFLTKNFFTPTPKLTSSCTLFQFSLLPPTDISRPFEIWSLFFFVAPPPLFFFCTYNLS